jgi:magnesium transporter
MEKYYEDLEDKLSQIINDLSELQEYIDSLENTFKSMIDLKTNFVIKVLTVFSASLLPLTVITSFYGMNINLPYSNNIQFILFLLFTALFIMVFIYLILRKTGRF